MVLPKGQFGSPEGEAAGAKASPRRLNFPPRKCSWERGGRSRCARALGEMRASSNRRQRLPTYRGSPTHPGTREAAGTLGAKSQSKDPPIAVPGQEPRLRSGPVTNARPGGRLGPTAVGKWEGAPTCFQKPPGALRRRPAPALPSPRAMRRDGQSKPAVSSRPSPPGAPERHSPDSRGARPHSCSSHASATPPRPQENTSLLPSPKSLAQTSASTPCVQRRLVSDCRKGLERHSAGKRHVWLCAYSLEIRWF